MAKQDTDSKSEGFSAYIHLSDDLQFSTTEIEEALLEDYPGLDIQAEQALSMPQDCDTAEFITAPLLFGAGGADTGIVSLIRLPDYGTWDAAQLEPSQRLRFPDIEGALAQNASYICVSVGATATDDTSQFRAARLCSCLAAVFAKLPIAVGVYWESADQFLTPEDVVQMADKAMADEFPVEEWIGLGLAPAADAEAVIGVTKGVRHFQGTEMGFSTAPVELTEVVSTLLTTAHMVTSLGHQFHDGDTLGASGQPEDESFRIRHIPAETWNSESDLWLLVHPKSSLDVDKLLGKRKRDPWVRKAKIEQKPQYGFLKGLMRRGGKS